MRNDLGILRAPYLGITAFLLVLFVQPLGHTVMIVMEHYFGVEYLYQAAMVMGGLGAVLLWVGMRDKREVASTLYGFFAGTLLWTGWIEFSFVFYARHLDVAPLIEAGEIVTKPEYLLMPSSLGVMLATLAYFAFNRETKCNFFHWMQRNLKLSTGEPTRRYDRSFAAITALETIYVIWFFYVVLLLMYDNAFLGDRHVLTYVYFFINTVWALYLFRRLLSFSRGAAALRYAVPTAIIAWTSVELLGRWNFFKEFWVHPLDHALEMTLVFLAFGVFTALAVLAPARKSTDGSEPAPGEAAAPPFPANVGHGLR